MATTDEGAKSSSGVAGDRGGAQSAHIDRSTTAPSVGAVVNCIADQFELAWQSGRHPEIEQFLTNDLIPQARDELLRELVLMDIACRKQFGATLDVDSYRRRFPELDRWLSRLVAIGSEFARANAEVSSETSSAVREGQPTTRAEEVALDTAHAGKRVSCPHCRNPIDSRPGEPNPMEGEPPDRVLCPACGGSFRILDTLPATTTAQSRRLGKFDLMERLGVGAFGEVWRARDTQLGRDVAIKTPRANLLDSPEDRERFLREARAAAQLRHPGIVPVHDVVEIDGRPIIVSGFVDGLTLHELLEIRRLTFRESAALVADVAESLDYAHRQGLVHRDIKPANILIEYPRGLGAGASLDGTASTDTGPAGDSAIADSTADRRHHAPRDEVRHAQRDIYGSDPTSRPRPMILDFGLALRPQAEATITRDNQPIGTPAYMSPEQAAGESHEADARSDVYSLGVVLYELLVGEIPFRGNVRMITLQVLNDEPRPPRRANDRIPRDLETICLKSMSKSPGRRYSTAADLAADLRRWLRGEPIHARAVTTAERVWRWAKRNRLTASLAAGMVAVLAFGLTIVTALWLHADRQRQLAESEGLRATRSAADAIERQHEAETERTRAEENYQTARRAVDEFFTQVGLSRELKAQGLESFRRHSSSRQTSFTKSSPANARMTRRLKRSWHELMDVSHSSAVCWASTMKPSDSTSNRVRHLAG